MKVQQKVILGVTGSIAAYKSAEIVRRLTEKGLKVSVVLTKEAENFITPLTLSALSGEKVYRGTFNGEDDAWQMPHIKLAQEASAVLIAPATANIISKLAHGLADDLLTCLCLTTRAPIFIAPAMNTEMYQNKIIESNCRKLKETGVRFIEPSVGKLACGVVGVGHLAEESAIVEAIEKVLRKKK